MPSADSRGQLNIGARDGWLCRRLAVPQVGYGAGWLWRRLAVRQVGCGAGWLWRRLAMAQVKAREESSRACLAADPCARRPGCPGSPRPPPTARSPGNVPSRDDRAASPGPTVNSGSGRSPLPIVRQACRAINDICLALRGREMCLTGKCCRWRKANNWSIIRIVGVI